LKPVQHAYTPYPKPIHNVPYTYSLTGIRAPLK
jgi:hypothetical protein